MKCLHRKKTRIAENVLICKSCSVMTLEIPSDRSKKPIKKTFTKPDGSIEPFSISPIDIVKNLYKKEIRSKFDADPTCPSRKEVIKFIRKICIKYYTTASVLHLAVAYFDDVFKKCSSTTPYEISALAVGCFILAYNFIEPNPDFINYEDFVCFEKEEPLLSDDIYRAEVEVCQMLNYNLNRRDSSSIVSLLLNGGVVYENEINSWQEDVLPSVVKSSKILANKALENAEITRKYTPLMIAISCVFASRELYGLNADLGTEIEMIYGISTDYYNECFLDVLCKLCGKSRKEPLVQKRPKYLSREKSKKNHDSFTGTPIKKVVYMPNSARRNKGRSILPSLHTETSSSTQLNVNLNVNMSFTPRSQNISSTERSSFSMLHSQSNVPVKKHSSSKFIKKQSGTRYSKFKVVNQRQTKNISSSSVQTLPNIFRM